MTTPYAPKPIEPSAPMTEASECERTVKADVVVLEQMINLNRLGAVENNGQMFALVRDVVPSDPAVAPISMDGWDGGPYSLDDLKTAGAGNVRMRSGKRPRPIVLRANIGDCLQIRFTNLLSQNLTGSAYAGFHVAGLELRKSISDDASWVGDTQASTGSFVTPGETTTYTYYATDEGVYFVYSGAGNVSTENNFGLFGAVNVQPKTAEWYRSQVNEVDLGVATFREDQFVDVDGIPTFTSPSGTFKMTLTPQTRIDDMDQRILSEGPQGQLYTLTTFFFDSQTVNTTTVVLDPLDMAPAIRLLKTEDTGHPIINYEATYPPSVFGKLGNVPILAMLDSLNNIVYSDLTAIITGPNAGRFLYSYNSPLFYENPASPDRRQPFREFTIMYHDFAPKQAFPILGNTAQLAFEAGQDQFGVNYGFGGIGAEILANRLHVGPEGIHNDEVDLKFEEFFLSAWSVGDPAMIVDLPANQSLPGGSNAGKPANTSFYPDDPSNVYHSYMRDHVKFRIMNATSAGNSHVHHQHAHQWLHSPNSDDSHYLDSQLIVPGSTYTLEMVYNGSGNRNQTVGDSIFHCHFYPHFAQGMWAMWRVHDVFESGTKCERNMMPDSTKSITDNYCKPATATTKHPVPADTARALPDGELEHGSWIPALVPMPTIAMAPMPAKVRLATSADDVTIKGKTISMAGRRAIVEKEPDNTYKNPGYPFFIPGVGGHRPPHPPLDFAWEEVASGQPFYADPDLPDTLLLDGGLPRHLVLDGFVYREAHTRWDFTKDFVTFSHDHDSLLLGNLTAFALPETGTAVEKAAMKAHSQRAHASYLPSGDPGNFILNGLPPIHGAPYAEPGVNDGGSSTYSNTRRYKAANIELDAVFNKKGWHYPQQRIITLWEDVAPTIQGVRPPEPFFFRSNSGETIDYWHTNLMPNYYELDDFQVRTPTDVIGQHIHLVKFDVTSSDGAANGFNYEDGTFSTEEIHERMVGINQVGGLYAFDPATDFVDPAAQDTLTLQKCGIDAYKLNPKDSSPENCIFGVPAESIFLTGVRAKGQTSGTGTWASPYDGAWTTIQRWDADPLLNDLGFDRTLRTVFTHDHLSPSTHQQAGLYAGLLIEPQESKWFDPVTGEPLYNTTSASLWRQPNPASPGQFLYTYERPSDLAAWDSLTRKDGGPTSWQAIIRDGAAPDYADSFREFALEFQDFQLAYTSGSKDSMTTLEQQIYFGTPMLATWAATLNAGDVPGLAARTSSSYTGLDSVFVDNGITLSQNATVSGTSPWTIMEPDGATGGPDAGQRYRLEEAAGNYLNTYTETLTSWSDYISAIQAPDANTVNTVSGRLFPQCGTGNEDCAPFPTLVSTAGRVGSYSLNYRSESVPQRVNRIPTAVGPGPPATDLSFAFASIPRQDSRFNTQPATGTEIKNVGTPCPAFTGAGAVRPFCFPQNALTPGMLETDPFTPLLRAYENDNVQIRTLVGAHVLSHSFELFGLNWEYEPSWANSGKTSVQGMGISEHYEMVFTLPSTTPTSNTLHAVDYLYAADSGTDGFSNGLWGILRSYDLATAEDSLQALPNNPVGQDLAINYMPPAGADTIHYDIVATTAAQAVDSMRITYNSRLQSTRNGNSGQPALFDSANSTQITDSLGLVYVMTDQVRDGNTNGITNKIKEEDLEPLILRAAAGDWIEITLHNCFDTTATVFKTATRAVPPEYGPPQSQLIDTSVGIDLYPSPQAGLHPQLVSYDAATVANGIAVGFNQTQTVPPPSSADLGNCLDPSLSSTETFYWYAGDLSLDSLGNTVRTPMEFGAINLLPSDPLQQHPYGLVGALIVEPEGSAWVTDDGTRAAATVTKADGTTFRDFVALWQPRLSIRNTEAVNYRTETLAHRYEGGAAPTNEQGQARFFSNTLVWTQILNILSGDPQTPIFTAAAGTPTRFRMLLTRGLARKMKVLMINGHNWQEAPYIDEGRVIGDNVRSQQFGSQQIASDQTFNLVLESAGGTFEVPGDYLYHLYQDETNGAWGLFRVDSTLYVSQAYLNKTSKELTVKVKSKTASSLGNVTISISGVTLPDSGKATYNKREDAWVYGPVAAPSGLDVCDLVMAKSSGQTSKARLAPCKKY